MFWLLVIAAPICVELAGWVVDATFLTPKFSERHFAQAEDPFN